MKKKMSKGENFFAKYVNSMDKHDFPIHIDTISMGLPFMYFQGSQKDIL